jgi:hypothetical protein
MLDRLDFGSALIAGALGFWSVAGCGGGEESPERGLEVVVDRAPEREEPRGPRGDNRFDEEGELLESDERVGGLILPRGMTEDEGVDGDKRYFTRIRYEKVLRYIGPRLITGEVERHGDVVIYRNARARDAVGGEVRMDVRVVPDVTGGTRLIVRERSAAPPITDESSAEIVERLNQELRQLD